jgi:hypothetical protein
MTSRRTPYPNLSGIDVNQAVSKRFCKRQQMQWSKRDAHLLLQARAKTLDREWVSVFKSWYPDLEVEE